mmetsp:Transcript_36811/g.113870  ORF Transcript_36811/g.113870 Transcript_36811/m.113870 type:complete len:263 (+) Transcript_36811:533-1321(+)
MTPSNLDIILWDDTEVRRAASHSARAATSLASAVGAAKRRFDTVTAAVVPASKSPPRRSSRNVAIRSRARSSTSKNSGFSGLPVSRHTNAPGASCRDLRRKGPSPQMSCSRQKCRAARNAGDFGSQVSRGRGAPAAVVFGSVGAGSGAASVASSNDRSNDSRRAPMSHGRSWMVRMMCFSRPSIMCLPRMLRMSRLSHSTNWSACARPRPVDDFIVNISSARTQRLRSEAVAQVSMELVTRDTYPLQFEPAKSNCARLRPWR